MFKAIAAVTTAVASLVPGCNNEPPPMMIFGEDEVITVDVSPPTVLSLQMADEYRPVILSPGERCDGYGGTFDPTTLVCQGVDY